MIPIIYR